MTRPLPSRRIAPRHLDLLRTALAWSLGVMLGLSAAVTAATAPSAPPNPAPGLSPPPAAAAPAPAQPTVPPSAPAVTDSTPSPSAAFDGFWLGTVTAPQETTPLGFAFKPGARGPLVTLHLPAMFVGQATIGRAELAPDGTLRFPPLDTVLRREGDRLVGTFGLSHLPVELRRVAALPGTPPVAAPPAAGPAPAPAWSTRLSAELWATPAVADDTVFLGDASGKFHALDAASGRLRWSWSDGPRAFYGRARVTATHVYALDAAARLVALHRADGRLAWQADLAGPTAPTTSSSTPPAAADPTYNHRTATPVLVGDALLVPAPDGTLHALDATTGAPRWRHATGSRFHTTPTLDGDRLWLAGHDGTLLALDLATRREAARTRLPGPLSAAPVLAGDLVIVGCRDYTLYALGRTDLSVAWRHTFWFSWIESEPALVDGTLYIGGSDYARISALDPATGRARWSTVVAGLTWGTPLVTPTTVYAGTSAQADAILPHTAAVVALTRSDGTVRWRHPIPAAPGAQRTGVLGSPVLAAGHMIVATVDGTLLAWRAE